MSLLSQKGTSLLYWTASKPAYCSEGISSIFKAIYYINILQKIIHNKGSQFLTAHKMCRDVKIMENYLQIYSAYNLLDTGRSLHSFIKLLLSTFFIQDTIKGNIAHKKELFKWRDKH